MFKPTKEESYLKLVVFACYILIGIECAGFPTWYFIQRSTNPYQVFKDAQTFAVLLVMLGVILSYAITYLTMRVLVKKSAKLGNTLPQANSFIDFLKVSRIWVLVPFSVLVIPLVFMKTASSILNAPEGLAREVVDIGMVFFSGLGLILILIGFWMMVGSIRKISVD